MANNKKIQADRMRAQIAAIRDKIALSDSPEEIENYNCEIAEIREKIRNLNRKPPVVVPVKHASTVGDKIERRLKSKGRSQSSTYGRTRVKL